LQKSCEILIELLEVYQKIIKNLAVLDYLQVEDYWRQKENVYMGISPCRCCNADNGSAEYVYAGWKWPEGYRHYLEEHNVEPSASFMVFINNLHDNLATLDQNKNLKKKLHKKK
jgi:hypothetical protein